MREIKFRAWTGSEMTSKIAVAGNGHKTAWTEGDVFSLSSVLWPIMQFTGLKDKNGKEIYEEDIVELPLESGEKIRVICRFGTVQRTLDTGWLVDVTGFYFQRSDGLNSFPIVKNYAGKHDLELFEVVGNLYENSDLLKS